MSVSNNESAGINVDVPCRKCGEMLRKGSIRCRECGTFVDPEVEQRSHDEPSEVSDNLDEFDLNESLIASENDFEVAPGVTTFEASESAFALPVDLIDRPDEAQDEQYAVAEDPIAEDPLAEEAAESSTSDLSEAVGDVATDTSEVAPPAEAEQPPTPSEPAPPGGTTGDVLLDSALAEEAELNRGYHARVVKPQDLVPGQGVVVYCPSGHRIHVDDKYRGRMGRCPHCRSPFLVPGTPSRQDLDEVEEDEEKVEDTNAIVRHNEKSGKFDTWLPDVRLHRVQVSKLRLKEGSLADESDTIDLGFAEDSLLVATVFKGKGGLTSRSAARKKPELREKIHEFLESNKKKSDPSDIPSTFSYTIPQTQFQQIWIAQPAPPKGESLFADIDLFGTGVIGIRLPSPEASTERFYITPTLSQYRELARILAEKYSFVLPTEEHGIPLTDEITPDTCHYTGQNLAALQHMQFYQTDPRFELELIGHRCTNCGSAVSEASRQQKKLGGKSGSGIAKAKCPACEQRFGEHPLYGLKTSEAEKD